MGFLSKAFKAVKKVWSYTAPIAGAVVGSLIPGVGTAAGLAVGSSIGGALSSGSSGSSSSSAQQQLAQEQAWSAEQAQLNRDFQKSERIAAQEFQLEMWNMNNNYNSPVEQLKRAQAAGINPNAVFNNGYTSAVSQPVTTTPSSGSMAVSPGSLASTMLTSDAVVQNLLAQAANTESQTDLNKYQLSWNKLSEKERYDNLVNMNDKQRAEIIKLFSDVDMNLFSKEMQEKTFRWFSAKTEEEIKVMRQQVNLLRNQSISVIKEIEKMDAEITNLGKQGNLIDTQVSNTQAQTHFVETQDLKANFDAQLSEIGAKFSQITGLPQGTSEFEAMFALALDGRFDDIATKLQLQAINNGVNSSTYANFIGLNSLTGDILNSLGLKTLSILNPRGNNHIGNAIATKHN